MRRLESNERERMRMHSLNDAFQVVSRRVILSHTSTVCRQGWREGTGGPPRAANFGQERVVE
jgi:hypothetical protein